MRYYLRPVALIATILSVAQSVLWFILSLLSILCYTCTLGTNKVPSNFRDFAVIYFRAPSCDGSLEAVRNSCLRDLTSSDSLIAWTSIILAVNAVLFISSVALLIVLSAFKKTMMVGWMFVYLFFSVFAIVLDVGFTIVLSEDFQVLDSSSCFPNNELMALTVLVMATIASKGIILWVVDVCLTIYLLVVASRVMGCQLQWDMYYDDSSDIDYTFTDRRTNPDKEKLNRPIEVLGAEGRPVPPHSALGRWPMLMFSSSPNLAPVTAEPRRPVLPGVTAADLPKPLPSTGVSREPSMVRPRPQTRHTAPPPAQRQPPPPAPPDHLPVHQTPQPRGDNRPMSLQEAIRTMRPLRPVRNSPYRTG